MHEVGAGDLSARRSRRAGDGQRYERAKRAGPKALDSPHDISSLIGFSHRYIGIQAAIWMESQYS
jgi:hypothetical protein